jgi:hypothetical protein
MKTSSKKAKRHQIVIIESRQAFFAARLEPSVRFLTWHASLILLQHSLLMIRNFVNRFWRWTLTERPSWRESKTELAMAIAVFGVTGSTSVALIRPTIKRISGLEGTMKDGPWSYRIGSILLVSPVYACVLLGIGTLAGRHRYFANQARKILIRFVPKRVRSHVICSQAKSKTMDTAEAAKMKF